MRTMELPYRSSFYFGGGAVSRIKDWQVIAEVANHGANSPLHDKYDSAVKNLSKKSNPSFLEIQALATVQPPERLAQRRTTPRTQRAPSDLTGITEPKEKTTGKADVTIKDEIGSQINDFSLDAKEIHTLMAEAEKIIDTAKMEHQPLRGTGLGDVKANLPSIDYLPEAPLAKPSLPSTGGSESIITPGRNMMAPQTRVYDDKPIDFAQMTKLSTPVAEPYVALETELKRQLPSNIAQMITDSMDGNIYLDQGLRNHRKTVSEGTIKDLTKHNPSFKTSTGNKGDHVAQDFYVPIKGDKRVPINAFHDSEIVFVGNDGTTRGEYMITYSYDTNQFHMYAHLDPQPLRTVGDFVRKGEPLANMGYSGRIFSGGKEFVNGRNNSDPNARPQSYVLHFEVMYDPNW